MERWSCFWTAAESGVHGNRSTSLEEAAQLAVFSGRRLFEAGLSFEADPHVPPRPRWRAAPRGAILRRPCGTQDAAARIPQLPISQKSPPFSSALRPQSKGHSSAASHPWSTPCRNRGAVRSGELGTSSHFPPHSPRCTMSGVGFRRRHGACRGDRVCVSEFFSHSA